MSEINDIILLNAIKELSKDKLIDLIYSEKFNDFFKKNEILANMLSETEKLLDNDELEEKWNNFLTEKLLPNTHPSMLSQSIRLKIIPFDESLALKSDKAIEVNSYFIQDLNISLETVGFSGEISFVYPYQTEYDSEFMEVLTSGLPLQIEIFIKNEFFLEDDQKQFIEDNGDSSNEEIKILAYTSNASIKETSVRSPIFGGDDCSLLSCNGLYKVSFCDAMSFFWKQIKPVSLYSGQSYDKVFGEHNTAFDKLVKLTFDKSSDTVLKEKLPFICVNSGEDGFYGYVRYILQQYNLILIYSYSTNEYIITSDFKDYLSQEDSVKSVSSIFLQDKQNIKNIRQSHCRPYLFDKSIINVHIDSTEKQQLSVTELEDMPKKVEAFKQDSAAQHDLSSLFKLELDKQQEKYKNNYASKNLGLEIKSSSIPSSYSIFPLQNKITFSSKEWSLILGDDDKDMVVHKVDLSFEKTPLYTSNGKRHPLAYEDRQEGDVVKDKISFEFEDEALENSELPLMFNCYSKFHLYNKEFLPQVKKYDRPQKLTVNGSIFTTKTDNDKNSYSSSLFNYSADSSESVAVNDSYSGSEKFATLDPNTASRPRYQVKISPYLWTKLTSEDKQLVPADMLLPSYSNMLFYLKSGTEVGLEIFEEYANIVNIRKYIAPQDMFSSGDKEQNQAIVFENREEQNTVISSVYKPSDDSSSFKISHSPADNGSPSNLEMNNKSFKISVDCKE